MKNRRIIATVMAASMLFACVGCSSKKEDKKDNKDNKKVIKAVTSTVEDFFDALIDRDDSIADYVDEDAAEYIIEVFDTDYGSTDYGVMVNAVFETFSYEIDDDSIEIDDDEAEVEVTFTCFDDSIFFDQQIYNSLDEVCDVIRNGDTREITLTVELELNDDDEWIVTNAENIVDTIGESVDLSRALYEVDDSGNDLDELGYTGYSWYNADDGTENVYTDATYINFWAQATGVANTYYIVERNGQVVYTSNVSYIVDCYFYARDYSEAVNGYLPEGTYTFTLYLEDGTVVDSASCEVLLSNGTTTATPSTGNGIDVTLEGDTYNGVSDLTAMYEEAYGIELQGEMSVDYVLVLADDGQFGIYVDMDQIMNDFTDYMRTNLPAILAANMNMTVDELELQIAEAGMTMDQFVDTAMQSMTYTDSFESRTGTYTVSGDVITFTSQDNSTYTGTINADGSITLLDTTSGMNIVIEFQPA